MRPTHDHARARSTVYGFSNARSLKTAVTATGDNSGSDTASTSMSSDKSTSHLLIGRRILTLPDNLEHIYKINDEDLS